MRHRLFFLAFLIVASCAADPTSKKSKVSVMPKFNLLLLDSTSVINTSTLLNNGSVVMVFFDPYCPYCQAETESIINNIKKFNQTKICMLSVASMADVKDFSRKYALDRYSNVVVGIDTAAYYMNYFEVTGIPHTSLYASDGKLKDEFFSQVDAEKIIDALDKIR